MSFFEFGLAIRTLACLALFGMFASAEAQEMTLSPSRAVACLARKDGKDDKLIYPEESLTRKDGGVVNVEMTFTAPNRSPRVKTDNHTGSTLIDETVSDYVDGFRLPCMDPKEGPVTLRQDYVFVPNDGRKVTSTTANDVADAERTTQLACIKNSVGNERPTYPLAARDNLIQGKFLVEMTFSSPDKAPELRWLMSAKSNSLRWSVEEYMSKLRMPCQHGDPVRTNILFDFRMIDGDRTVLRDLTLRQFIAHAKEVPRQVYFNLDTMGCPFDLRVKYMRPHEDNVIAELETSNPARKPFIDWLSKLTINFTDEQLNNVLGDSFTLSVPCGSVNL